MASAHSPLIIGHRGASAVAPENTLAAFARALDDGADGFELDVRLARDGVPVVIHDATLKRTGLRGGAVGSMPASELAAVDVGTWFNREHPVLPMMTTRAKVSQPSKKSFNSWLNVTLPNRSLYLCRAGQICS